MSVSQKGYNLLLVGEEETIFEYIWQEDAEIMTVWTKMLLNGSSLEWPNPQAHDDDHTNKHRAGHNFINHSFSQTQMCLGAWELTLHKNKTDTDCNQEYFISSDPTASGCTGTYSASSTLPSVLAAKCDDATCTTLQTSVTNLGKILFLISFFVQSFWRLPPEKCENESGIMQI